MGKKIAIGAVIVVCLLIVIIATRPDQITVERSVAIEAPPDVVYGIVADFHNWVQWSPWEALDPAMKKTFDGPPSGKGASYAWEGNDQVGTGKMTIVDAKAPELINLKLEFLKPWESVSLVVFAFKGAGPQTTVTWTTHMDANFMMKAMTLFKSMDSMMGPDFERGLAKLKTVAEAAEKKRAAEVAARKAAEEAAAKKAADEAAAKKAADEAAAAAAPPAKKK